MELEYKVENLNEISEDTINELAHLYHVEQVVKANDDKETVLVDEEYYYNEIKRYTKKKNSFLISGYVGEDRASTTFILNIEDSPFITKSDSLKNELVEHGTSVEKTCVPAYIFVKKAFRGHNFGVETDLYARSIAKENGYTHLLGFGSMNEDIRTFYGHKYKVGDTQVKKIFLETKDYNGKDISLYTL